MARPESQFKRILKQIQKDVLTVTVNNGYVTEFQEKSVHMLPKKWKAMRVFPHCYITYNGNTIRELYNSRGSKVIKKITMIFFLRDSKAKPTIFKIADLETDLSWLWMTNNPRLKEDVTGDDLVTKIKLVSDTAIKVTGEPFEIWTLDLEVTYHQRWDI